MSVHQTRVPVAGQLERNYRWVDVDENPAEEKKIARWNEGRAIRPTIDIEGEILINPEREVLKRKLESHELIAAT